MTNYSVLLRIESFLGATEVEYEFIHNNPTNHRVVEFKNILARFTDNNEDTPALRQELQEAFTNLRISAEITRIEKHFNP